MKTTTTNRFDGAELIRFVTVLKNASDNKEARGARVANASRLSIHINQQDASFLVSGTRGAMTPEEIYTMFPEVKDDVVDLAAPLTQTTPVVDNAGTTSAEAATNETLSN